MERLTVAVTAALVGLFVGVAFGGGDDRLGEGPGWWQDQAALLDPQAYRLYQGTGWEIVVPNDETWYSLGLWHILIDGDRFAFQRQIDARNPLPLPPGTRLAAAPDQHGYAYVARPALVSGGPGYSNGEALYRRRMDRLRSLPQKTLAVEVPGGSPVEVLVARLPVNIRGVVTLVSAQDVAWTGLIYPDGAVNLNDEISDTASIRFAVTTLVPFDSGTFSGVGTRPVRNPNDSARGSLSGYVLVRYAELPSDW